MGDAGLVIHDMEEPAPPARLIADTWDYPDADTIPRVLIVIARRTASVS